MTHNNQARLDYYKPRLITKVAILLLCYANITQAQNTQFVDFFSKLESLSANFIQYTYNGNDVLAQTTSGSLIFNRPKQFKWHATSPNEQILLLNDNQLWLIDVELEQASLQQAQDLSATPLYWLINKPSLITTIPTFSHRKNGTDWYQTSTNSEKYQQLEFGFKGEVLSAISFKNALQQTVVILFDKVIINPSINPQAFELNLSPDFDVIR